MAGETTGHPSVAAIAMSAHGFAEAATIEADIVPPALPHAMHPEDDRIAAGHDCGWQ